MQGQSPRADADSPMQLALYQPDIPQNLGALIRLAACFAVPLEIIEPCGFPVGDRAVRRVALDYGARAEVIRYASWPAFLAARRPGRLVLLTTGGETALHRFRFAGNDTLLLGRESAGAPAEVHAAAEARLRIPLAPEARSLNVVTAAAIGLAEALRQTGGFAAGAPGDPMEVR